MAAPTTAEIRAGLAANLATVTDTQVSAYRLGSPTPPCIEVFPDETEYDRTMGRGNDTRTFIVRAMVGAANDKGAQVNLDLMLDVDTARSVRKAIESDKTLGGKVNDLRVIKSSGDRVYALPNQPAALGCEWTVEIDAPGK